MSDSSASNDPTKTMSSTAGAIKAHAPIHEGYMPSQFVGASLRDHFAGQALGAIIIATSEGRHMPVVRDGEHIRFAIARDAYDMADAMIKARTPAATSQD